MDCKNIETPETPRRDVPLFRCVTAVALAILGLAVSCPAASYTLSISATQGSVTVDPDQDQYDEGEKVQLIAKPDTGYYFTGWGGDASGTRIVLNLTMDGDKSITANFGTWEPPIGIPAPGFGILELHTMYLGQTYDFGSGAEAYKDAGNGPYTHYVDSSDASSTDDGNPYGTPDKPRRTIPDGLTPGSVVEIHNSAAGSRFGPVLIEGIGTAEKPIFVRGVGMPRLETGLEIGQYGDARYIIVEGLDAFSGGVLGRLEGETFTTSHIAVRKCNFTGDENNGGFGLGSWTSNTIEHVVLFGNVMHDNGIWDPLVAVGDQDVLGLGIGAKVSYAWIVDNEMYHNSGDGMQINAGADDQSTTHHIYVGRNVAHHNKQAGLWTKQAVDVIFSENEIFGHRMSSSQMGPGMGFQYGPERVWFLFNKIYDCEYGITFMSTSGLGYGTESYCIGNLIYDIHYDPVYHDGGAYNPNTGWAQAGIMTAGGVNRHFIGNTIHDVDAGISVVGGGSAYFAGNIISSVGSQGESHIWCEDETSSLTWEATNNLIYQPGGVGRIKHYTTVYTVSTLPAPHGTGNLDADPKFIDPNANWHLQGDSPAIDVGLSLAGVEAIFDDYASRYGVDIRRDIEGRTRTDPWDLGAYEYGLDDAVDDLAVSGVSQNALTLTWTVPGQEGVSALPGRYDIRYAQAAITEANWDAATEVQGEPAPSAFGESLSFTVTGLDSGTTYYLAIRAENDGGTTVSPLSNVVPGTTASSGNHAPVLDRIGDKALFQGGTLDFTVSATDADAGDTLTYSAANLPFGASFTAASRTFSWAPTTAQSGTYAVKFSVTDGQVEVSETITISVSASTNHAPELSVIGDKSVAEGQSLGFSVSATDIDGGTLTYSVASLPSGANFVNRLFSWVPTYSQAGSYSVTFTVTDNGGLTDSEQISITVTDAEPDLTGPSAHDYDPVADAIQVPLNSLIALTISDAGDGVDASTVAIRVDGQVVYSGNTALYESDSGDCRRIGSQASYRYYYEPDDSFDFNRAVTVSADATDLAGNAMTTVSYQFLTEMRSFGDNRMASPNPVNQDKGSPATVCDSSGDLWVVYHAGVAGQRDVHISKLAAGESDFSTTVQLTTDLGDQADPDIAIGSDNRLYVVWQDDRQGNSDIYITSSADGTNWSAETRITDDDSHQVAPAIAVDNQSTDRVYVAWQDDRDGQQEIYVAYSDDRFATSTVTRVTSETSDQSRPAIALDADSTVYLVWTDGRNGTDDVYGGASDESWTNVPLAVGAGDQFEPDIATESEGTTLHFLWTDTAAGDGEIHYASSDGMPSSALAGTSIIDDTSSADQSAGSMIATGSGDDLKVLACWQDSRNVVNGEDTDLYFTEIQAGDETNVLVGDDGTGSDQSAPALALDGYGYPYVVWTDDRGGADEVYYAGSTFADPTVLDAGAVTVAAGGTVGTSPPTNLDDVSVVVPAGVCPHDATITIARVHNPPKPSWSAGVLAVDFGPSGLQFTQPVTVTIPYRAADFPDGAPVPYWYDPETATISQQGISNIERLTISTTVRAVRFRTNHFTAYVLAESTGSSGGGGGGGCALSPTGQGDLWSFLVPYLALVSALIGLKLRDRISHRDGPGTSKP